jgi:hypothetical protein
MKLTELPHHWEPSSEEVEKISGRMIDLVWKCRHCQTTTDRSIDDQDPPSPYLSPRCHEVLVEMVMES